MKTRLLIFAFFLCTITNSAFSQNSSLKQYNLNEYPYYLVIKELKETKSFFRMDHDAGTSPVRISYLHPSMSNATFGSSHGIELSSVWCGNPRSVFGFRYQLSGLRFADNQEQYNEEYIIPSFNMGFQLNFLGDFRLNVKPYTTAGWNPVWYRYDLSTSGQEVSYNQKKWYLNNWAWNYGFNFDFWFTKGFGISTGYEMTRYLAGLVPEVYMNNDQGLALKYSSVKISIMF